MPMTSVRAAVIVNTGVRSRDLHAWRRGSATDMQDARLGGVGIWELTRRWYCRFRSRLGRPRGLRCEVGAAFLTRNTLRFSPSAAMLAALVGRRALPAPSSDIPLRGTPPLPARARRATHSLVYRLLLGTDVALL